MITLTIITAVTVLLTINLWAAFGFIVVALICDDTAIEGGSDVLAVALFWPAILLAALLTQQSEETKQ